MHRRVYFQVVYTRLQINYNFLGSLKTVIPVARQYYTCRMWDRDRAEQIFRYRDETIQNSLVSGVASCPTLSYHSNSVMLFVFHSQFFVNIFKCPLTVMILWPHTERLEIPTVTRWIRPFFFSRCHSSRYYFTYPFKLTLKEDVGCSWESSALLNYKYYDFNEYHI